MLTFYKKDGFIERKEFLQVLLAYNYIFNISEERHRLFIKDSTFNILRFEFKKPCYCRSA